MRTKHIGNQTTPFGTRIARALIPTFCIASFLVSLLVNLYSINASALTYQQSTDLEFTFNSTISLTVSGDLNIEELTPGDSSDSNIIDINVATNNVSGYNLSATVGNTTNPSTNLTHTNNSTYKFTSLTTDTTTPSDFDPNTWGYSYSIDNGTTWISNPTGTLGYSHLPLYTTTATTLKQNYNPASDTINFKIAAKASNIQPSGAYTNTINFTATAFPSPMSLSEAYAYFGKNKVTIDGNSYYTMQDMETDICQTSDIGSELQVADIRDNGIYYVSRLSDGNCWMTQNLDLCIGCTNTAILDSTNTDLNKSGSGAYVTDYATSDGVITWAPTASTMTGAPATIAYSGSGTTAPVSGWANNGTTPYMAEGGDERVVQGNRFTDKPACVAAYDATTCEHDHVGNYYNWTTSIASSNSSAIGSTRYETAANSICPKGWRLPKGPDGTNGSEFEIMLKAAGIANPNNTDNGSGNVVNVGYIGGGDLSSTNMEKSPYYFARSGYVSGITLNSFTSDGRYWSGSVVSGSDAFVLHYHSSALYPASKSSRDGGWGLRCLAK